MSDRRTPREILMTADPVSGVWSYALILSRALAEHGVRVALATMGGPLRAEQRSEALAVPMLSLHESRYALEWMNDPWRDVEAAGAWLLELERGIHPDVVHLNGYAHGALPWAAPRLVVAHSCVLSWWEATKGEPAPERYIRYRQKVTRGLAGSGAVVAATAAMLRGIEALYGVAPRTHVIPNALETTVAAEPGPKEPFVFAAGRLFDSAKNVAAVARCAPDLGWPVVVAGDPRGPDGAPAELPAVELLGWLPASEVRRWMQRAAVYALPARYEPFGLSILEAATRGCALVLGDIPSLRELWGDAAVFVRPDDERALTTALRSLIEDEARRVLMARRARTRAMHFARERMTHAYLALYEELLVTPSHRKTLLPCA